MSRRCTLAPAVAAAASLAVAACGPAAPGSPDPTFGGDGTVTTSFGAAATPRDALVQPDGKVVVVGDVAANGGDLAMARYGVDGSPDRTFAGDGTLTFDTIGAEDAGVAVARQPDGKLVVAGTSWSNVTRTAKTAVFRFHADGSPDRTFNGQGWSRPGSSGTTGSGVVVLPSGHLLVAGSSDRGSEVVRLTPAGGIDGTFNGGLGRVDLTFRDPQLLVQPAAGGGTKAVVVGTSSVAAPQGGPVDVVVATRLSADTGLLDRNFGSAGLSLLGQGVRADAAVQPDGRILVSARDARQGFGRASLWRLTAAGQLDPAFGSGGAVDLGYAAGGVAVQGSTAVFAVGQRSGPPFVVRTNASGGPVYRSPEVDGGGMPATVAVGADGRAVLVAPTTGTGTRSFQVTRLSP